MLNIFVISDSIGETGEKVVKSVISQYELIDYEIKKFSYILEPNQVDEILVEAQNLNSIIIYTLVDQQLSEYLQQACAKLDIPVIDLLNPLLNAIAYRTNLTPLREPGINRKLDDDYFRRVEAIEFAVRCDDGNDPRGILNADLVLIGVSRTSKTPLSMYLANRNYKIANITLVPEVDLPKELYAIDKQKIIGLKISIDKLNMIRQERLQTLGLDLAASYASLNRIDEESNYAENIMAQLGCETIDISNKAIEETASIIINYLKKVG